MPSYTLTYLKLEIFTSSLILWHLEPSFSLTSNKYLQKVIIYLVHKSSLGKVQGVHNSNSSELSTATISIWGKLYLLLHMPHNKSNTCFLTLLFGNLTGAARPGRGISFETERPAKVCGRNSIKCNYKYPYLGGCKKAKLLLVRRFLQLLFTKYEFNSLANKWRKKSLEIFCSFPKGCCMFLCAVRSCEGSVLETCKAT